MQSIICIKGDGKQYIPSPILLKIGRFYVDRMKRVKYLIVLCLLMINLQACSDKNYEEAENNETVSEYFINLPSRYSNEERPIICINSLNIDNYSEKTMRTGFTFNVLSKEALTDEDVEVVIDVKTPYKLLHLSSEKMEGKFSDYVCLNYNEMDWTKLKELELDISEEGQAQFAKIKEDIENEYVALDEEVFPKFYDNEFFIQFDMTGEMAENEEFRTVQIVIGEDTYDIDVGYVGLKYSYESPSEQEYGEYDLFFTSVGRIGFNILQNKEGIIDLNGFEATVNKDVKIKNIKLMNISDSMKIDEVDINIVSEDMVINRKWEEGKDIDVAKGSKLYFDFKIKDEEFAKVQNYATNIYIQVEYEVDGNVYVNGVQALCESRYDGQTLYAMYKDGVDMSEYYSVYYD